MPLKNASGGLEGGRRHNGRWYGQEGNECRKLMRGRFDKEGDGLGGRRDSLGHAESSEFIHSRIT